MPSQKGKNSAHILKQKRPRSNDHENSQNNFSPFDTQLLIAMEILLKVQKAMIKIVAATKLTILSKFTTMYLFYTTQF